MLRISIITALAALATSAVAQDAIQTDGDKYKVILENACVRVLDYQDAAGEKTHQHTHPAFVLYALSPFKRTLTLPDGKVLKREFKAGDVMWSEAQTHIGENIGETPTHVVIVELKQAGAACSTKP
jgi:quercetin dioxygenase-like cupin family protein